nr:class I SAM-dependent methyltransferase [Actinomycetota bacterium]
MSQRRRLEPAPEPPEETLEQRSAPAERPIRRGGAPRLIEWTGERCVPWAPDVRVVYEHYHRYLWAAELARDRRVLDLGSGEGYGSAILAATAGHVHGLDVDERTVEHARLNYSAPNLEFSVGSALDLSRFEEGEFDLVVAFEVIEHVEEQERLLDEAARVLAPGGALVVSTPERRVYAEERAEANPFHERELTESELQELLGRRFPRVALWGQSPTTGSRIAALGDAAPDRGAAVALTRTGHEWAEAGELAPTYLIAVASRGPLELPPRESTLHDHGLELLR